MLAGSDHAPATRRGPASCSHRRTTFLWTSLVVGPLWSRCASEPGLAVVLCRCGRALSVLLSTVPIKVDDSVRVAFRSFRIDVRGQAHWTLVDGGYERHGAAHAYLLHLRFAVGAAESTVRAYAGPYHIVLDLDEVAS